MSSSFANIRAALGLAALLGGLGLSGGAWAQQSRLPACAANLKVDKWHNCYATYTFSNGQKYDGEFKNGKREGIGTTTYPSGQTHVGEYKNNNRDGKGTSSWLSGQKYDGEFKYDKYDGQGTFTYPNGAKFIGRFSENKRNGAGVLYTSNGSVYEQGMWSEDKLLQQSVEGANGQAARFPACPTEQSFINWHNCLGNNGSADTGHYFGEFRDGKRNGQGTLIGPHGMKYAGQFSNDWKHGRGTLTWPDGAKYVGYFSVHKLNGQGTMTWADGRKYVGDFKDGQRTGQGTEAWPSGAKYVGEFRDGKANGQGTHTWPTGHRFVGEYKDDAFNGQGTHTWPNGQKYVGAFKDGKYNGQGTYTWPNGNKYVGEWKDDKRNGEGVQYGADGAVILKGRWENDKYFQVGNFVAPETRSPYTSAQSNPAGNLPILEIDGMFPSQRNKGALQLLYKNEGKIIYLNGIDLEFQYMSPHSDILKNCYKDDSDNIDYGRLEDANIALPQPLVSHTTDEKTIDNGNAYKDYACEHYVSFTMLDKRRVPTSSAGTGMLTVVVRKPFLVSLTKSGYMTTFNLREMAVSATNSPSIATPPSTAAPQQAAVPKASSGSAFRIANGQFVTNHHVINNCTSIKVDRNLGGNVIASDATKDLALISISNDSGPIASIRTTRIQLNESITAAGFPLEGAFSGIAITNGTISRLSGLRGDTGEVQISAPVQPGNSGGPLLDTAGNVIGVVSSKLNALKVAGASGDIPQNVNFAINGSSLRAFLDAKNVNYKEVGNERELTGVQIAARASVFTVLIECQR